ncbi:MAG: hypothetical protein RL701_5073 [Pseudomonadota bacterium]
MLGVVVLHARPSVPSTASDIPKVVSLTNFKIQAFLASDDRLAHGRRVSYTVANMLSPTDLARLATALGGLPILGCLNGSPAADAGIRYGDILLSVDGKPTTSWDDFLAARKVSTDHMLARVFRQGVEFDISIPLRPATRSPTDILGELQTRGILPTARES